MPGQTPWPPSTEWTCPACGARTRRLWCGLADLCCSCTNGSTVPQRGVQQSGAAGWSRSLKPGSPLGQEGQGVLRSYLKDMQPRNGLVRTKRTLCSKATSRTKLFTGPFPCGITSESHRRSLARCTRLFTWGSSQEQAVWAGCSWNGPVAQPGQPYPGHQPQSLSTWTDMAPSGWASRNPETPASHHASATAACDDARSLMRETPHRLGPTL